MTAQVNDVTKTPLLNLLSIQPSTLEVLRHVLSNYGYDTKEMPLEVVQRELRAMIGTMEMYE